MAGAQVYKASKAEYVFQDKYFGRKVTTSQFPSIIASFLHDGDRLLVYHIPGMLRKLYRLAFIVLKLTRYRFYASSLLFIYDGDREVQDSYAEAHALQYAEHAGPEAARSPTLDDEAYMATLSARGRARHRAAQAAEDLDLPEETGSSWTGIEAMLQREAHTAKQRRSASADEDATSRLRPHRHSHTTSARKRRAGHVTIRLIDFAHCTTGDDFAFSAPATGPAPSEVPVATFPPTHPDLPDTGFLLGLRSLCRALERIWEGERTRRTGPAATDLDVVKLPKLAALKVAHADVFEDAFPGSIIEESRSHGYVGAFEPLSATSSRTD
jgi:hypothetical protein